MITVNVTGHGSFVVDSGKLDELLTWLRNNSMPVEKSQPGHDGFLLNEKKQR